MWQLSLSLLARTQGNCRIVQIHQILNMSAFFWFLKALKPQDVTLTWPGEKCVDLRWCTFRDVITLNYHSDSPGGRQLVRFWWILVKELSPMIRHTSFYRKIGAWYLDYLRLLTHVAGVIMIIMSGSTGWWFGTFHWARRRRVYNLMLELAATCSHSSGRKWPQVAASILL